MKVAITGGTGKMGQYVADAVTAKEGVDCVRVISRHVTDSSIPHVEYLLGDITDLGQTVEALSGVDAVMHLAAIRKPGIVTDQQTFVANVVGTFNVFEAAYRLGIPRVIYASSSAVYGYDYRTRPIKFDYLPLDESHPTRPQDVYGLSKLFGESIGQSYVDRCEMNVVALRAPWIVSPQEVETLLRNGGRTPHARDILAYIDVRDLADACVLALSDNITGFEIFNICADDTSIKEETSVALARLAPELSHLAEGLAGRSSPVSNRKAKNTLGWQPTSWESQIPRNVSDGASSGEPCPPSDVVPLIAGGIE